MGRGARIYRLTLVFSDPGVTGHLLGMRCLAVDFGTSGDVCSGFTLGHLLGDLVLLLDWCSEQEKNHISGRVNIDLSPLPAWPTLEAA